MGSFEEEEGTEFFSSVYDITGLVYEISVLCSMVSACVYA